MKRRIVAAMLAGVMALGMLAGCGGSGKSDSDGGSSDKKSSDANIAVFYYTYSDTYRYWMHRSTPARACLLR